MRRIFCNAIVVILLLLNQVGFGQIAYSITDLGTLGGGSSEAAGINDSGQVVGDSYTSTGADQAFLYINGSMSDLGTLQGSDSVATAINDSGQIVGTENSSSSAQNAFLYSNGTMTDLGTLVVGGGSSAAAINDSGQIVGTADTSSAHHAVQYAGSSVTDLGTLGGAFSQASAINSSGQIVGASIDTHTTKDYNAYIDSSGIMTSLGTLGGTFSEARGINDNDQVVGDAYTSTGADQAFLYSAGKMSDLGTLGGTTSAAIGINNSAQIVGNAKIVGNLAEHAFVYSDGSMTDLNKDVPTSSGWTLNTANAINNLGQIVGTGTNPSGQSHAFLLTPHIVTTPVTTAPPPALIMHYVPTINNLDVYNPSTGTFQNAQQGGVINVNLPTVVLTLGWNETITPSGVDSTPWVLPMAQAIASADNKANVVAWDWSSDADTGSITAADSSTWNEGLTLGLSLASVLGSKYNQKVQFMGHSLGTLVNSEAISVLYPHVPNAAIQDTLFDEASIANHFPGASPPSEVPAMPVSETTGAYLPLARIDNYISSFGEPYSQASNFILQSDPANPYDPGNPLYWDNLHSFPMTWYEGTFPNGIGQNSLVGYSGSIVFGSSGLNDPTYQPGTYQLQSPYPGQEYNLSAITPQQAVNFVTDRNTAQKNIVQAHPILANLAHYFFGVTASQLTGAIQYENSVVATLSPDFGPQLALAKEPNTALDAVARAASADPADGGSPSTSSYAWIPLSIPTNVEYLSVDFTFLNLSPGDFLTIGIGDTPLFQLEDQFATNGMAENSGLIDISQWAGQDIQLFVGLNAADDNNIGGTITVDNFQFGEVPEAASSCQICIVILLMGVRPRLLARR